MPEISFEWDSRKSRANLAKHGVSFDEASTAFYDESGFILDDPDHSDHEDRFVLLGLSASIRLLVVVHCFRGADDVIRLISARKATPSESARYEAELRP